MPDERGAEKLAFAGRFIDDANLVERVAPGEASHTEVVRWTRVTTIVWAS